jgi:hypothetical protein
VRVKRGEGQDGVRGKRGERREEHTRIPLPLQIIIFLFQLCK